MKRMAILITAAILVITVGVVGYGTVRFVLHRSELNEQSKAFVDRAMVEVASNWDPSALIERATPALREKLRHDELAAVSDGLTKAGRFWQYDGSQGGVHLPYASTLRGPLTATYIAHAAYAGGLVTFHIGLIIDKGKWAIDAFHVDIQYLDETPTQY